MCMEKRRRDGELLINWAERVNGLPNDYKVNCYFDGVELEKGQGQALVLPECGIMPRYTCPACSAKLDRLARYHENANRRDNEAPALGTLKKGSIERYTIGVEIEHMGRFQRRKAYRTFRVLIERTFNVIEESDCTVSGEFPTDKMNGGNKLSKALFKLESYGFMVFLDCEGVGAHIHIYCNCIDIIRNWYHTLFTPLQAYLLNHDEEWLIEHFGRSFGSYRVTFNSNTPAQNHSNFVNTQHSHTLEFRLPRIHNKAQYMNVVYFWREAVATLNNTEWIPNNDCNRQARKTQAQAAGQALVNIAIAYFGE